MNFVAGSQNTISSDLLFVKSWARCAVHFTRIYILIILERVRVGCMENIRGYNLLEFACSPRWMIVSSTSGVGPLQMRFMIALWAPADAL
jgi:hypothetical protein